MTTLRLKNDRHVSPNMYEETLKYICIFERSHYYLKNHISLFFLHCNKTATTQQTLVLMKTSSRRLQDVFGLLLQKTSSEDVFRTSSRRLNQDQHNRLGHTSSRRLQDVLQKRLQDIFKTSSRHFQDVFKTYSRRFQDVSSS